MHPPPPPTPLVARDIVRTDGERRVLVGVDLLAHPGPPLGVIGENGAGKSTLMRNRATGETLVSEAISLLRPHDSAEITAPAQAKTIRSNWKFHPPDTRNPRTGATP